MRFTEDGVGIRLEAIEVDGSWVIRNTRNGELINLPHGEARLPPFLRNQVKYRKGWADGNHVTYTAELLATMFMLGFDL